MKTFAVDTKPRPLSFRIEGMNPGRVPVVYVYYSSEEDRDEALRQGRQDGEPVESGPDCSVVWR